MALDLFETHDFKANLLSSGIIKVEKNFYKFSKSCFYYFAIAYWCNQYDEDAVWLCQKDKIIKLHKAIEYYAAMGKSKDALINNIKTWCEEAASITEKEAGFGVFQSALTALVEYELKEDYFNFNKIKIEETHSQRLFDDRLDHVDPLLEAPETLDSTDKLEVVVEEHNDQVRWIESISLFARIVKASEQINKRVKKIEYFVDALKFYDKFLYYSMQEYHKIILPAIKLELSKIIDLEDIEKNKKMFIARFEKFLTYLGCAIPNQVFMLITNDLINNKSIPIIKDIEGKLDSLQNLYLIFALCRLDNDDGFKKLFNIPLSENYVFYIVFIELMMLSDFVEDISPKHRTDVKVYLKQICTVKVNSRKEPNSKISDIFLTSSLLSNVSTSEN